MRKHGAAQPSLPHELAFVATQGQTAGALIFSLRAKKESCAEHIVDS